MSEPSLYEKVLSRLGRDAVLPQLRPPRASAAVVAWRQAAGGLEVYWLRRSESLAFMGGWWAFPGGGLSRRDAGVPVSGRPRGVGGSEDHALPEAMLDGIDALEPTLAPGLAVCALRELFEETGLLPLAAGEDLPTERRLRVAAARRRLLAGEETFAAVIEGEGLEPDASQLVFAGRWVTPPLGPVRFDNRFFLLEWPASRAVQPEVIVGEADRGEWIAPAAALDRWRRGELITAPPILHILEALADGGVEGAMERLRRPEEANLGPFRRIEFRPGVLIFPLATPTLPPASFTNCYLLGAGEAVLVDPGSPFERERERLRRGLEAARDRLGRRVVAIWLTHHHPDHVGGVEAARSWLEVPVLAHRRTAERLHELGIRVDGELEEGQRIELAGDAPFPVRVIHTPGHARGHLCFYEETHGSLLGGDLVAGFGTIFVDPPEGRMEDYLASLRRIRDLGARCLFPAHGPAIWRPAARLEEYLRHRLWRERRVLEAWEAGCRTPAEIVDRAYDDLAEPARPLAERQVVAHLERLREQGEIEP